MEFIVQFSCGDTEFCDSIEEARERIAEHGFDCEWTLYRASVIEYSPEPPLEA